MATSVGPKEGATECESQMQFEPGDDSNVASKVHIYAALEKKWGLIGDWHFPGKVWHYHGSDEEGNVGGAKSSTSTSVGARDGTSSSSQLGTETPPEDFDDDDLLAFLIDPPDVQEAKKKAYSDCLDRIKSGSMQTAEWKVQFLRQRDVDLRSLLQRKIDVDTLCEQQLDEILQEHKELYRLIVRRNNDPTPLQVKYSHFLLTPEGTLNTDIIPLLEGKLVDLEEDYKQENLLSFLIKLRAIFSNADAHEKFRIYFETFTLYQSEESVKALSNYFQINESQKPTDAHFKRLFLIRCMQNDFASLYPSFEAWWSSFSRKQ